MTYSFVAVSGTFPTLTGTVTFTPPNEVTDLTGTIPVLGPGPVVCTVSGGSFTSPPLLGTDNVGLLPAGWTWLTTVALTGQRAYSYPVLVPAAGGTTATLSSLPVSAAGGGVTDFANPMTITGDMIVGGAGGAPQRLAIGGSAQVLTSNGSGTTPTWQASPSGFTNPMTTLGDLIYGGTTPTAGSAVRLAGGTTATKQFLAQTGTGSVSAAPQWGTIATTDVPVLNQNTTGTASNVTGVVAIINGGTGGTTATAAYNALSPMTTTGDIEYESANGAASRLAGNTTSTRQFLASTGSGGTATAPAWGTIASADMPTGTTSVQGALQLNGTAGSIAALGVQAAGNSPLAAAANHGHPFSGTVQAAGIAPVTSGFTCFYTGNGGNTLNTGSGTNSTPVAGSIYWAALFIPVNITVSGVIFSIGTTAGTDKWIGVLYNSSGALVGNSDTAGISVTAVTANKQKFTFTGGTGSGPVAVAGPGAYYIGLQSNGTHATFLSFANNLEGFVAGSVTGSFGTVASITPGATFTSGVGPFASTY